MRPRFPLSRLFVLVAVAAVASALVAFTLAMRSRAVQGMTAAILASATVAAISARGRYRAFWLGFAASGWAYYAAAFAWPQGLASLPTTRPLVHLIELVVTAPTIRGPEGIEP